ncbi:Uu.00g004670.m01.CDS01 [Anthostomella pinea]|uniref:Trafficking protein particle complex subunit n=1 Tax=Anthostomella pinea TaxID=933095 RepID=A0AAI8VKL2_9PEZI|nr:Uu.00g004670.m01.CDS01 [Anthostomella pinea]
MPIQVYSFYIFDRHTECVYSKLWHQPHQQQQQPPLPSSTHTTTAPTSTTTTITTTANTTNGPHHGRHHPVRSAKDQASDDAKLIFGTVFSLRNMVRKLGGEDDAFIAYRTQHYKLHYYETPTNLRFALLTEPAALSMRNVLHQIYINLWVEYVVKNPLAPVEHKGGEGVRNEMFEMGLDKFIRGLM